MLKNRILWSGEHFKSPPGFDIIIWGISDTVSPSEILPSVPTDVMKYGLLLRKHLICNTYIYIAIPETIMNGRTTFSIRLNESNILNNYQ